MISGVKDIVRIDNEEMMFHLFRRRASSRTWLSASSCTR
jgi:hypothetical protein